MVIGEGWSWRDGVGDIGCIREGAGAIAVRVGRLSRLDVRVG